VLGRLYGVVVFGVEVAFVVIIKSLLAMATGVVLRT